MKAKELFIELYKQGYHCIPPSDFAAELDGAIAHVPCPNCSTGMAYHPMMKPGSYQEFRGDAYRAFAVCPNCDYYREF